MNIEFLRNNQQFINEIALYMFKEWGHLRENTKVDRFIDAIKDRLNESKIPLTIVAKSDDGNLLGFASLVEYDMEINRDLTPWISGVFVLEQYRKQGIGRVIVSELERIASDLGYNQLYLFTFDKVAFYSGLSWKTVKEDFYLNSKVTIMIKK